MKAEQHLRDRYPELLDGSNDPELVRVVAELDALSRTPALPRAVHASIGRELHDAASRRDAQRLAAATSRGGRFLRLLTGGGRTTKPPLPARRGPRIAGLAAFAIVIAIIVAGLAATLSQMQPSGRTVPGGNDNVLLRPAPAREVPADTPSARLAREQVNRALPAFIVKQDLGREINLSQTVDGYTVSVRRVYADRDRIVIGYAAVGPPGRELEIDFGGAGPTFTDAEGNSIEIDVDIDPLRNPLEVKYQRIGMHDSSVQWRISAWTFWIKTPPLRAGQEEIRLRWEFSHLNVTERIHARAPYDALEKRCDDFDSPAEASSWVLCDFKVYGAFGFDLRIPIEPVTPDYAAQLRLRDEQNTVKDRVHTFLNEWVYYMSGSEGPEATRLHGEKARMLLAEGFNKRVPDLKAIDLPGLKLKENYADTYEVGPFPPGTVSGDRAQVPVVWLVGREKTTRWFELEKVGGHWRIAGIRATKDGR
jgi:hypothetical protein